MIEIAGLVKAYKKNIVLKRVDLSFDTRGIDIIVGINGSGKTTLFNCICDITPFDEGTITVQGVDVKEKTAKKWMYYIPSDFYLPEYLTGKEYANFVFSRYDHPDHDLFAFIIDIYHMSEPLNKMIGDYSYGMKKKLQIAVALSLNVQYILADEIFNGLDYESYLLTEYLIKQFSSRHKFILISHNMDYINRNPQAQVHLLNNGRIELLNDISKIEEIVINSGELKNYYEQIDRFIHSYQSVNA